MKFWTLAVTLTLSTTQECNLFIGQPSWCNVPSNENLAAKGSIVQKIQQKVILWLHEPPLRHWPWRQQSNLLFDTLAHDDASPYQVWWLTVGKFKRSDTLHCDLEFEHNNLLFSFFFFFFIRHISHCLCLKQNQEYFGFPPCQRRPAVFHKVDWDLQTEYWLSPCLRHIELLGTEERNMINLRSQNCAFGGIPEI